MIKFCHDYHITLGHSTAYYPQGNGLVESSNKSLVKIIKKLLQENKKSWHLKLINALWADRICIKRSIGTSPFEIVYGVQALFPVSLAVPVMKLIQEQEEEPSSVQRRINQMIALEEKREHIYNESQLFQQKVKKTHDKRVKEENFLLNDCLKVGCQDRR